MRLESSNLSLPAIVFFCVGCAGFDGVLVLFFMGFWAICLKQFVQTPTKRFKIATKLREQEMTSQTTRYSTTLSISSFGNARATQNFQPRSWFGDSWCVLSSRIYAIRSVPTSPCVVVFAAGLCTTPNTLWRIPQLVIGVVHGSMVYFVFVGLV